MNAAHDMQPAPRRADPQDKAGRTAVIVWAVLDDAPGLDGLADVPQEDTALIQARLRVGRHKNLTALR